MKSTEYLPLLPVSTYAKSLRKGIARAARDIECVFSTESNQESVRQYGEVVTYEVAEFIDQADFLWKRVESAREAISNWNGHTPTRIIDRAKESLREDIGPTCAAIMQALIGLQQQFADMDLEFPNEQQLSKVQKHLAALQIELDYEQWESDEEFCEQQIAAAQATLKEALE